MSQPPFLVDCILPSREIHLVAGPSGSGKTKWLLETLIGWHGGLPVLGYKSHPVPWVYVSADRSIEGVKRNADGIGIDPKHLPFMAAWDRRLKLGDILKEAEAAKPRQRLVVVEAFGSFVESPGMAHQVRSLMSLVSHQLRRYDMTLIGVMESPKMKPREKYENPRQRISGVAAWGHYAETIILIEPKDNNSKGPERLLWLCPRNAPTMCFQATLMNRLVVAQLPDQS